MLGLGGLNDFLSQQGERARGASETRTATLTSGMDLPLGFSATLSYALTRTQRFQQVGEGPRKPSAASASGRWKPALDSHILRGPLSLVAAGAGIREREGTSIQLSGSSRGAQSATISSAITPNLQISFRNGLGLVLSFSNQSQRTESNGTPPCSIRTNDRLDQLLLRPAQKHQPGAKQIRSTLTALSAKTLTCLERELIPGVPPCRMCGGMRSAADSIPTCSRP